MAKELLKLIDSKMTIVDSKVMQSGSDQTQKLSDIISKCIGKSIEDGTSTDLYDAINKQLPRLLLSNSEGSYELKQNNIEPDNNPAEILADILEPYLKIPQSSTYKTYTAIIDEDEDNPKLAVTYSDDAVSFEPESSEWFNTEIFKDIRPCVLKEGKVKFYLDSSNYSKLSREPECLIDLSDYADTNFNINPSVVMEDVTYDATYLTSSDTGTISDTDSSIQYKSTGYLRYTFSDIVIDSDNPDYFLLIEYSGTSDISKKFAEEIVVNGSQRQTVFFDNTTNTSILRLVVDAKAGTNTVDIYTPTDYFNSTTNMDVPYIKGVALVPAPSLKDENIGDVMIEIPKMGYKINKIDSKVFVSVTRQSDAEGFCYDAFKRTADSIIKDNLYIGVAPQDMKDMETIESVRQQIKDFSDGYSLMTYTAYNLIVIMSLLYYRRIGPYIDDTTNITENKYKEALFDCKKIDNNTNSSESQYCARILGIDDFCDSAYCQILDGLFINSTNESTLKELSITNNNIPKSTDGNITATHVGYLDGIGKESN